MNIGSNLREIRHKQNISQQEVADFLEIDRRTYRSWEEGKADIKSLYLPKLAEFLHVELSELFREKSTDIVINQHNSDNKDSSINGVIFLLTDKESMDKLVEIVKKQFDGRSDMGKKSSE